MRRSRCTPGWEAACYEIFNTNQGEGEGEGEGEAEGEAERGFLLTVTRAESTALSRHSARRSTTAPEGGQTCED